MSARSYGFLGGLAGIAGVVLLFVSFAINSGPPANATGTELMEFGQQNYAKILWGAWMQALGPVLMVLFALSLVHLAGATHRLAGSMTLFGATVLMTVSLIEISLQLYSCRLALFFWARAFCPEFLGIWRSCWQSCLEPWG